MLFEVAILQVPTEKEKEDGKFETIILKPTPVVAADDRSAAVVAAMQYTKEVTCDTNRLQVLVRPFA